jgi:glycosyltransferase 2 family protein
VKIDRRTRVAVEAVVSAVVLGLLLRWAGLHEVAKTLRGTDLAWFVPAVVVSAATVPAMALRWQLLLQAKRVPVPLGWLTRTYFVALFAGQFLPAAIGGDAVRVVELGRRTADAPEAVASVLIDRLVGLVSLVVLAVVAVLVSGPGRRVGVVAAEGAFGAAAAAALLLLFSSRLRGAVARRLEPRAAGRRLAAGGRFYDALHAYRAHRATLIVVGLLALAVQVARVGVIWMLAKALGLNVPDSVVLLAGPVVFAALALPVSLNGIGVREAVFVYFLHGHATRPEAIALGLAFFAVGTLTALGGAAVLVVRFIRYGVGAVRPRTEIGEPPGAESD